jgi:hypothetical protein
MSDYQDGVHAEGEGEPIGQIIDQRGVRLTLSEGDLVADVVIIAKVVEVDGRVRLALSWSDGMSWIERFGMLHGAVAMEQPPPVTDDG